MAVEDPARRIHVLRRQIQEFKPDLNAAAEAQRARAEAKSDISALGG